MLTSCKRRMLLVAGAIALIVATSGRSPAVEGATDRWASAMEAFALDDAATTPRPGGVLFLGSSSIRMWDLDQWFPGLDATNRGFGGSEIADSIRHFDRLVLPHRPRLLVFYAGDNDIAKGKTPKEVTDDFKTFAAMVRKQSPETRIAYIAIKPSLARWGLVAKMREANRRIAAIAAKDKRIEFIDIDTPMLGDDGRPREELFLKDGLHLSDKGYAIWTRLVEKVLQEATASDSRD